MVKLVLFLHLLGSTTLGFYLLLPFLTGRLQNNQGVGRAGYAALLVTFNRIGQYMMIVQLATGGYLIGQGRYSPVWSVMVLVLFITAAALAGMMGKPLKRLRDGTSSGADAGRIRTFTIWIGVLVLAILFLMKYPELFV